MAVPFKRSVKSWPSLIFPARRLLPQGRIGREGLLVAGKTVRTVGGISACKRFPGHPASMAIASRLQCRARYHIKDECQRLIHAGRIIPRKLVTKAAGKHDFHCLEMFGLDACASVQPSKFIDGWNLRLGEFACKGCGFFGCARDQEWRRRLALLRQVRARPGVPGSPCQASAICGRKARQARAITISSSVGITKTATLLSGAEIRTSPRVAFF